MHVSEKVNFLHWLFSLNDTFYIPVNKAYRGISK